MKKIRTNATKVCFKNENKGFEEALKMLNLSKYSLNIVQSFLFIRSLRLII